MTRFCRFPCIVVKGDAAVDGAVDNFNGCLVIFRATKMVAAENEYGDLDACFAKLSKRYEHVTPSQWSSSSRLRHN
jgi:hypothetical protein